MRCSNQKAKVQRSYRTRSSRGGLATLVLVAVVLWIAWDEIGTYFDGVEEHQFGISKLVDHEMQINLDMTVAMPCSALHVNVRDAAGDRVLAGELLQRHGVTFDASEAHTLDEESSFGAGQDIHDALRARKSVFKVGKKTGGDGPACRIFGSLDVNRVQGDFHVTARGLGYWEGDLSRLDRSILNFSHVINELSFGAYYPKLVNPLDGVVAVTPDNFYRFQYYLSIVPTTYLGGTLGRQVVTNQYAVTEQSRAGDHTMSPGIFFKYDLEPLSLTVQDSRTPFLQFLIRLINIVGGVAICMSYAYKGIDVVWGKRRNSTGAGVGMLDDFKHDD